jgi:hypothetical protein
LAIKKLANSAEQAKLSLNMLQKSLVQQQKINNSFTILLLNLMPEKTGCI